MQQSINVRAVVIYGLIGLAILALIIFGISWAKNRSDQYAAQNQGQAAQEQPQGGAGDQGAQSNQGGQPDQQTQQGSESTANGQQASGEGQVSGAASTGPTTVPAAGPADWPILLGTVTVATFMSVKFWQSRRNLASLR